MMSCFESVSFEGGNASASAIDGRILRSRGLFFDGMRGRSCHHLKAGMASKELAVPAEDALFLGEIWQFRLDYAGLGSSTCPSRLSEFLHGVCSHNYVHLELGSQELAEIPYLYSPLTNS